MTQTLIGYARCSTDKQDLAAQQDALVRLGVATDRHKRGLGRALLARSLRDCYEAGQTFAFVAVVIDCIDDDAKAFYQHFDFAELPGHSYRLFLSAQHLEAMMAGS